MSILPKYGQAEKAQLEIEILLNGTASMPNALLLSKVLKCKVYTAQLLNFFPNKYFRMV